MIAARCFVIARRGCVTATRGCVIATLGSLIALRSRLIATRSCAIALLLVATVRAQAVLHDVGAARDPKTVEFCGVGAGEFDPKVWESGKLNFVPDVRSPLLAPREGKFRNIYAPSAVKAQAGWAIFYGGWDGSDSGNDRIYRADTTDWVRFTDRRTIIDHGYFAHVCNVNASRDGDGWLLMCTVFPDPRGLNRPAIFRMRNDQTRVATTADLIALAGYEHFTDADMNGANVLLHDGGNFRMYFNNFRDGWRTYRASSDDARHFTLDGVALEPSALVNDVKRFDRDGATFYLMALHQNGDRLLYAMSRDGTKFSAMQTLIASRDESEKFIVSAGWVVDGNRLLGVLYGAGEAPTLDRNRVFARWLQKKIAVEGVDAKTVALGPDRQVMSIDKPLRAKLKVFEENGETMIAARDDVQLAPGRAYEITWRH